MKETLYQLSAYFYVYTLDFKETFLLEKDDLILFTNVKNTNVLWNVSLTRFGLVLVYAPEISKFLQ